MTVKELIKILETMPKDMEIWARTYDGYFNDVCEVYITDNHVEIDT